MKSLFLRFGKALLDLIYPITCPICLIKLTENNGLCEGCASKIHKNEFGVAACQYEGILKEAVHLFKYKGVHSLLNTFSRFMSEFIDKNIDMKKIDTIIPVPLHPVKLRERGFNQAYILSLPVSKKYDIPISVDSLIKIRPTQPQSNFNRSMRLKNLKGAFSVKSAKILKGKRVLLIDDVYTTGATINEASRVLRRAGVADIKVVTLARGI